jgi:hypothetical protein
MNSRWSRERWAWFVHSPGSWRWLVASVLGLLEAREKRGREEIAGLREEAERVQAALGEAIDGEVKRPDSGVQVTQAHHVGGFPPHPSRQHFRMAEKADPRDGS